MSDESVPSTPRRFSRTFLAGAIGVLVAGIVGYSALPRRSGDVVERPMVSVYGSDSLVLDVRGMFCESCESTIQAMLKQTPGVVHAKASVKSGTTVVQYDSTRVSPQAIVDVITRLGYIATIRKTPRSAS